MENKIKQTFDVTIIFLWLLSFIYTILILLPSSFFLDMKDFYASDTTIWWYTYINSVRNAKIDLHWTVIEEINKVDGKYIDVVHRLEREVLTEKWFMAVRRKIDHVFTETWSYTLNLTIMHNISEILNLKKITYLKSSFTVK